MEWLLLIAVVAAVARIAYRLGLAVWRHPVAGRKVAEAIALACFAATVPFLLLHRAVQGRLSR